MIKHSLHLSLEPSDLASYLTRQLNGNFFDGSSVQASDILTLLPKTLLRLEHCFSHINSCYYFDGTNVIFNHLNGDHYAMFLYLISNVAFKEREVSGLPEKLFLLNKLLNGIDVFFEVELPSVFLFVHPLGTVLGRAQYSDFFLVYQRCGVGSNHEIYPSLGPFTTLRPGSSVLGRSILGSNNTLAAHSLLIDRDLSDNNVYFGNPRDYLIRESSIRPKIWRLE